MAIIAYSETLIRFPSGSGVGTNIDILNKTQGSKVDPVRRELGTTYNSRALIDASAYGDDWMDYLTGQQDGVEVSLRLAFDVSDARTMSY